MDDGMDLGILMTCSVEPTRHYECVGVAVCYTLLTSLVMARNKTKQGSY